MTKKVTLLVILLPREATGLLVCARARVHVRVCMWQEAGPALHKRRVLSSSVSPHSPADRSPRQAVSDCHVQAVTAPGSACCLGACAHRARHPAWPARVLLGRCPRRQWVWNSATTALRCGAPPAQQRPPPGALEAQAWAGVHSARQGPGPSPPAPQPRPSSACGCVAIFPLSVFTSSSLCGCVSMSRLHPPLPVKDTVTLD